MKIGHAILMPLLLLSATAGAGEGTAEGYAWAEERDVSEESDCYDRDGGPINNSQSFTNGCLDFVRALEEEVEENE